MTYLKYYDLYLGNSGYTLRPWLMTPLTHADPDTAEERYTTCFKHVRSIIERSNGLLKIRFQCLLKHRVLHCSPPVAGRIVNACTVYTICVDKLIFPNQKLKKYWWFRRIWALACWGRSACRASTCRSRFSNSAKNATTNHEKLFLKLMYTHLLFLVIDLIYLIFNVFLYHL